MIGGVWPKTNANRQSSKHTFKLWLKTNQNQPPPINVITCRVSYNYYIVKTKLYFVNLRPNLHPIKHEVISIQVQFTRFTFSQHPC